jgi:N-glycosylase/DNA lyase
MDIYEENNSLIVSGLKSFTLSQVLECGQCFRFEKLMEEEYKITAGCKVITAKQIDDRLHLTPMTVKEFELFFRHYFDLDRDYDMIKHKLALGDRIMEQAISHAPGIRILNQDFWETLISFIISQNNRIPMIKKVIENLSVTYGSKIDGGYSFPTADKLELVDIDGYMALKTGFRAKYIKDAAKRYLNGELDYNSLSRLNTVETRNELVKIYGVGNKVADCVMLFGLGRSDVFPADVWIKRVISVLYYGGNEIPLKELQGFAYDKWGEYAGFAQQYLFHYARLNKIGTK